VPDLFPDIARADKLRRMIDCVSRELRMRELVYPKRVAAGQMSPSFATEQTGTMREVLETLWAIEEEERQRRA
jgi:hypothetical protein